LPFFCLKNIKICRNGRDELLGIDVLGDRKKKLTDIAATYNISYGAENVPSADKITVITVEDIFNTYLKSKELHPTQ
jgi:hypothetical protein